MTALQRASNDVIEIIKSHRCLSERNRASIMLVENSTSIWAMVWMIRPASTSESTSLF